MDQKKAQQLMELMDGHVLAFGGDGDCETVLLPPERDYLTKLLSRMPGARTLRDVLENIAAGPDGWRVGTVVQARGVKSGPANRWIVAAGPMPPGHEDDVLLVDEECAELLDAEDLHAYEGAVLALAPHLMHEVRVENARIADMLVDYYPREAFEPVPCQEPR